MREELIGQFDTFDPDIEVDVSVLIDRLLIGDIDFAAEAQVVIDKAFTEIMESAGYLTLFLIETEWQVSKIKNKPT